jgi:hypothetical protein
MPQRYFRVDESLSVEHDAVGKVLAPADEAELDSLRVCHHSNCPFFKAVLIQNRPTELLRECN